MRGVHVQLGVLAAPGPGACHSSASCHQQQVNYASCVEVIETSLDSTMKMIAHGREKHTNKCQVGLIRAARK